MKPIHDLFSSGDKLHHDDFSILLKPSVIYFTHLRDSLSNFYELNHDSLLHPINSYENCQALLRDAWSGPKYVFPAP